MRNFAKRYWDRVHEVKIAEMTDEDLRLFESDWYCAYVDDARRDLQALDAEFQEMVRGYGVQVHGNYLAASLGNTQDLELVRHWWSDFRTKHAKANERFVQALHDLAGLKEPEKPVTHLLPDHFKVKLKEVRA